MGKGVGPFRGFLLGGLQALNQLDLSRRVQAFDLGLALVSFKAMGWKAPGRGQILQALAGEVLPWFAVCTTSRPHPGSGGLLAPERPCWRVRPARLGLTQPRIHLLMICMESRSQENEDAYPPQT